MIVNGTFQFYPNEWNVVSEDAKDFIRALLVPNVSKRATAKIVPISRIRFMYRHAHCDGCSLNLLEPCI